MPYDVDGWIEVARYAPEELADGLTCWFGAVSLAPFGLSGDDVANRLFGLAKRPESDALFANAGIPSDASGLVTRDVEDNRQAHPKHGEGDDWHTHATWAEIREINLAKHGCVLAESEWRHVFRFAELLVEVGYRPELVRFVVWGNW